MTDPLRELLREARDRLGEWPRDSQKCAELIAGIEFALAQQPELVAEVIAQYDRVLVGYRDMVEQDGAEADFVMRVEDYKILRAAANIPPSATALIAEKDAEIERLRTRVSSAGEELADALERGEAAEANLRDTLNKWQIAEHALAQIKEAKAVMLPITGWRNEQGWVISPRGYSDFGAQDGFYSIALTDLGPAQAEINRLSAAPQPPASSNQENAGRKTRQPEETRGLLGASELSGDGHQIDDPQQVGPQPPAGKSQEPQGFNFEAADGEEGD